jgi:hypothetical protein
MSLYDLLARADYAALRQQFIASELVPLLKEHPELVEQWIRFSENKRCGGWWISKETREIGWFGSTLRPSVAIARRKPLRFASLEEAVAEFVVRELDETVLLKNDPGYYGRPLTIVFAIVGCLVAVAGALYAYYHREGVRT